LTHPKSFGREKNMSLTIDYVTMPPKSQEISQIQHADQTKMNQAGQEVAAQFQQQVENQTHQTIKKSDVDNEELRYREKDQKGKQGKHSSQENEQNETSDKKKNAGATANGHHFDMTI
jgi:hypothetical protein